MTANPSVQSVTRITNTCFMAIELSRTNWLVGLLTPLSDKISLRKIPSGDTQQLFEIVDHAIEKVSRMIGRKPEIVSCYEAGYDGFWLHRLLEARGVTNLVLDPASFMVSRKARRAKTDRLDAEKLVCVLMAFWRGEPKVCTIVKVPSTGEEDAKRLHRERQFLMKERIQHIGRIKGLLSTQGIYTFSPNRKDWPQQLDAMITGDGRVLPPLLRAEIGRHCRRLALVDAMLKEIDAQRDTIASAEACSEGSAPPKEDRIQRLAQLKGIGSQIATVLAREVFYRRFQNRRSLASYLGLTPSPFQSGSMDHDQGISKAGNPRARTTSIELAWLWLRYQPQSALAGWFKQRTSGSKGRMRRIIIVAVARKLVVALWRYLETGLVPDGAIFKA